MILPSLVCFLVSTLRPIRLKLRPRILLILTISSGVDKSSMLSMTMPNLEYSRISLTSSMLALLISGPVSLKAIIFKVLGSIIGSEMTPIAELVCKLRIGVPIRFELAIIMFLL